MKNSPAHPLVNSDFLGQIGRPEDLQRHSIPLEGKNEAYVDFAICDSREVMNRHFPKIGQFFEVSHIPELYPIAFATWLCVPEGFQNRGIGSRVLQELEAIVIRKDCCRIMGKFGYTDGPEKNRHFYTKNDWTFQPLDSSEFSLILIHKVLQ